jgi:lipoate-protein ligase B
MQTTKFRNLGIVDYKKAWDCQEQLFAEVASGRALIEETLSDYLLFCEHSHVYYTIDNNGQNTNLHTADDVLKCSGKTYYNTISSTNPKYFSFINPCEFVDMDVVTTMQKVLRGNIEHYDVQRVVKEKFLEVFGVKSLW